MRKLILLLGLLVSLPAVSFAQVGATTPIRSGATLPAVCAPGTSSGGQFFKTTAPIGTHQCVGTNTWIYILGAATSSTVGQVLRVTGAGTFGFGALDLADTDAITGQHAGTSLTADLEEEAHASEHLENAADEITVEALGTDCPINEISKSDGAGGLDCAVDEAGVAGTGVENYETSFTAQTSITVTGATHSFGHRKIIASCYDAASPKAWIEPSSVTVDSTSFDVVVTFLAAQTGTCVLAGWGGDGGFGAAIDASEVAADVATQAELDLKANASLSLTAGAGLSGGGDLSTGRTFATASDEADFIASGALTCGAATQGKAKVHTTPLQYCDNAGTPALQYAAYGTSAGVATSAADLTGTNVIGATEIADLDVASGGTGAATLIGILQGNGTSAFTAVAVGSTVGQVFRVTGASTFAPGALDLADADAVAGALPTANIAVALANQTSLRGNAMAAAAGNATIGQIIASGATALDFASTLTGACATVITATATGTASTDVILFTTNASIKAVTGYVPAATGGFSINAYPTTDTANFEACNWTAGTVDPGSITVNWKVIR